MMSAFTIRLNAPAAWAGTIESASQSWPTGVSLAAPRSNGLADSATVEAFAFDSAPPRHVRWPAVGSFATASIVGRPMSSARVSGWAERTASLAVAADADRPSWKDPHQHRDYDLPADVRASHEARTIVRAALGSASFIDDALLAASELTANAVQHAGGARCLTTSRSASTFTIGVIDERPDIVPSVMDLRTATVSGRGMAIVAAVSQHWGITVLDDRKIVWCEFEQPLRSAE